MISIALTSLALLTPWATQAPPPDAGPRIIALGDSTTAPRASVERVWSERLQDLLGDEFQGVQVLNRGVGGDTTVRAARRLHRDVLAENPDLVIIQFGINDGAIDADQGKTQPRVALDLYRDHLQWMIQNCLGMGAEVVLMTPNPVVASGIRKLGYADTVREVAAQYRLRLVDVERLFHRKPDFDQLLLDGMHPSDLGHAPIAEALAVEVGRALRARRPEVEAAPLAAGYTLPTLDLAAETARQIVVDREAGQYLGHPSTVLLEDGRTMFCVYPKGHGRGGLVMKRSDDAGLSWSERLPLPDNWTTSKEVPTIHRVIDAKGIRRLIVWSGLYPARLAVSEDDGAHWSPLKPVGAWGGIVVMGDVERLKDGRYMALFHDDGRFIQEGGSGGPRRFYVYKTLSRDGGLSWSRPVVIAHRPDVHLCEPGIVRSPDGGKLAVLLRENSRQRNSFIIFTEDEGRSWSAPRELPAALTGDRHTGRYAADGRLFISFRDTTRESVTQGDWVAWVGHFADLENGTEGQYRVRLMDNHHRWDCAYPALEVLADDTIVATTYGHWTAGEQPYIVSLRLKLAELDRMLD